MITRAFGCLLAGALVMACTPTVGLAYMAPEQIQIHDPADDANFINDQGEPGICVEGHCAAVPDRDNSFTERSIVSMADLQQIWFSNDLSQISVHVRVARLPDPERLRFGILYEVLASPGSGESGASDNGCLRFMTFIPGTTFPGDVKARLVDECNVGSSAFRHGISGRVAFEELSDRTGLVTMTFPRGYSVLLNDGATVTAPQAISKAVMGETDEIRRWAALAAIDTTDVGLDYRMWAPPPVVAPPGPGTAQPSEPDGSPGHDDPPGEKKGCNKGKGKKKGCHKGGGDGEDSRAAEDNATDVMFFALSVF